MTGLRYEGLQWLDLSQLSKPLGLRRESSDSTNPDRTRLVRGNDLDHQPSLFRPEDCSAKPSQHRNWLGPASVHLEATRLRYCSDPQPEPRLQVSGHHHDYPSPKPGFRVGQDDPRLSQSELGLQQVLRNPRSARRRLGQVEPIRSSEAGKQSRRLNLRSQQAS